MAASPVIDTPPVVCNIALMASIAKRPDGRWRARYRDDSGREHSRHFKRKLDAQRWLDEVTTSIVTGTYVDPRAGRITLRQYAEDWRRAAPHSPSMRYKVERELAKHVYPTFGDRPIGAIRPTAVQAWVTALPLAPSSAGVVLSRLSSILRAAVRDKVIASNPADGVSPPSERRRNVWIPELEQIATLRESLPERYRGVVDLVAGSGLRQGEVFGLDVGSVDFLRERAVRVERQLVKVIGRPHLGPPKTEESHRTVPLAQPTLDALAAQLAAFPAVEQTLPERIDNRTVESSVSLVFTLPGGRPMDRSTWSNIWAPAARAAKFPPRIGLHALRHWFASALIRHGESPKVVQRRLGHSSAAFTLDAYTHLWPDSDDRTREAVLTALAPDADRGRTEHA